MSSTLQPNAGGQRGFLGLVLLVAAMLLIRLGDDLPLRSHEALVAETARNMVLERPVTLADGSQPSPWLVPNFGGTVRLRKTPLPYWMVAGLARVTGGVDEWTARLPSALAAAGTVAILVMLLRRQHDRLTALLGGAVLVTSLGFLATARAALSDMPMTFFTTATLAALWMGVERRGKARLGWFALAGAGAGLAMMAKGPAPALVLAAPCVATAWLVVARLLGARQRGENVASEWAWALGGAAAALVLLAAIALPWPAYIYAHVPSAWNLWKGESFDRATGDYGHQEAWYFYIVRMPAFVAPWVIFFVWGLVRAARGAWREREGRPWLLFVGAWFVGTLAAFSAASGKQDHYILPLLPAAAIYTALALRHLVGPATAAAERAGRRLVAAHGIAAIVIGIAAAALYGLFLANPSFFLKHKTPAALVTSAVFVPVAVLGAVSLVGGAAATILARKGRRVGGMAVLLATFAVAWLLAWTTLTGPMDRSTVAARFGREVRAEVPPETPLWAYVSANNSVVFYVERPVPSLANLHALQEQTAAGRPFYLLATESDAPDLEAAVEGLEPRVRETCPWKPKEGYRLFYWPGRAASAAGDPTDG